MKFTQSQIQQKKEEWFLRTASPYLIKRHLLTPKKGNSASRRAANRIKHLARKQRRKLGVKIKQPKSKKIKIEKIIYAEYIKSKEWRSRCKSFYEKTGRFCKACGGMEHLNVHHMSYYHLGFEPDGDLIVLCQPCHKEYHDLNGVQTNMIITTKLYVEAKSSALFRNL